MRLHLPVVVAVACARALAAAFSNSSSGTSAGPGGVDVATYGSGAPSMLAWATGTLRVEDGCVYLIAPTGVRFLPVFKAAEARWVEGALQYLGERFVEGDDLDLGGGNMDLSLLVGLHLPDGCVAGSSFVVAPS